MLGFTLAIYNIEENMKNIYKALNILLLSVAMALVPACDDSNSDSDNSGNDNSGGDNSGGDNSGGSVAFSGNTSPASINASNAENLGKASGEAVLNAYSSLDLPRGISSRGSISIDIDGIDIDGVNQIILSTIDALPLPIGQNVASFCSSGTASISGDFIQTSGPVTFSLTYSNCVVSSVTFNGVVEVHYNDISNKSAGFTFTYNNFTVSEAGRTTTINLVIACLDVSTLDVSTCTYNSDFVGSGGSTHRVTAFDISGDSTSGFNGRATFIHSDIGAVSITISSITYNDSCAPYPNGGSISFSSSNGSSGTIIFNTNCTVSGTWNNAGNSGSF